MDNIAKPASASVPAPAAVSVVARIEIIFDANGQIAVAYPQDKALCYLLLEMAKDVIREEMANLKRQVQPAGLGDMLKFGRR